MRNIFRKRYPTLSWMENLLGGYVNIGPVTIFGENSMRWAVHIETRNGFVCFRLPFLCYGKWWPLYFYFSPDATPNSATFWLYGRDSFKYLEDWDFTPCPKCGQIDRGQTGEYPCEVCGLPLVWDDPIDDKRILQ